MSFICHQCRKTVRTVADVRNCTSCQPNTLTIPQTHQDSDWLTPAIIGYAMGGGFTHSADLYQTPAESPAPFVSGGGGDGAGGGSSSSWESSSSSSDSYSSSSSDSSSSDSGSSSSGSD